MAMIDLPQRQIHLDFHTSPLIPDVGKDFDPKTFAKTMKKAHVNSVTVFAKCHHGHLYYPTKHPARHPTLKPGLDLVGKQVDALHKEGIRAPIYISVLWDEFAANNHPEWVAVRPDGTRFGSTPLEPGWQTMDMASPYQDYLYEQTEEILKRYTPVDGIFFDICFNIPSVSKWAVAEMDKAGLDPEKAGDRDAYAEQLSQQYMSRFNRLVKKHCKQATVYFNSRPHSGLRTDGAHMTHIEIEALATGGWGYIFFPKNVRHARIFGKSYMGMTARFHRSWADFGGLKPEAALLYECCQMIAHGAACSVGDQLHPRGTLDKATYQMVESVYGHVEACEPYTDKAKAVTEIGVYHAMPRSGAAGEWTNMSDTPGGPNDGVTRMLMHLKHQFDVLDHEASIDKYRLLILPDTIEVDPALAKKLNAFVKKGGSLLLSGISGLDESLKPILPEMGVTVEGESPFKTTYLRFGPKIRKGVPPTDHVMYERGLRMKPKRGAEALAKVVEPYFDRSWRHFSSHNQTPAKPNASAYAAAIRSGRVITIPYPIFQAYGTHANLPYRMLVEKCLDLLLPDPLVLVDGPSTLEVTLNKQGKRHIAHLLQFVPDRRQTLDIVEDVIPLHDVTLSVKLQKKPKRVYTAPEQEKLPFTYAEGRVMVTVPRVNGHQMVVFE